MITHLIEGLTLWHGSYIDITCIDLNMCKPGLDFGRGFYVTSSFQQALSFVPATIRKAKRVGVISREYSEDDGRVNEYSFEKITGLQIQYFEEADEDWLHFVAHNRDTSLFPALEEQYAHFDIIAGKVANDKTAMVLNNYVSGVYGEPGTALADSFAIGLLEANRLTDQFCFKTERAVSALRYIRSIRYGDVR